MLLEFSLHVPLLDVFARCVTLLIDRDFFVVPQVNELPTLRKELIETKQALAQANQDKERLLEEVRKYNPLFEL